MRYFRAVLMSALLVGLCLPPLLRAQEPFGITVSAPKVYEEATLRAILEQAEAQLAALRPIGGATFDAAAGRVQGGSQTTSSFSLTAQGAAQPSVVTTETEALDAASGALQTTGVQTVTSEAASSPAPPTPPPAAALTTTGFGLSARDLLAEQMALAQQIANLRLTLAQATSDRVTTLGSRSVPRYPVILGFTVGIDRPRKNRVAEVELRLRLTAEPDDGQEVRDPPPKISLVSVLPAKDAYNVAAITDSSTNIGVGQIVSAFQLGAGYFRGRKTYYVVRDVDTLSIAHAPDPNDRDQVRVTWQFRPVLGRKIVEPGPRQVFVALAIDDRFAADGFSLAVEGNLRWVKVRRNGVLRPLRSPEDRLAVDLGDLKYWEVFGARVLEPWVESAELVPLSDKRAMVSVRGAFLTPDSRILLGDRILGPSEGLSFRGTRALSFVAPLVELARATDVYLINDYQTALSLRRVPCQKQDAGGTDTGDAMDKPPSCQDDPDQTPDLKLELEGDCKFKWIQERDSYQVRAALKGTYAPEIRHLMAIAGDTVVAGIQRDDAHSQRGGVALQGIRSVPCEGEECAKVPSVVTFELPSQAVRKSVQVVIRELLGGPLRSVHCNVPPLLPIVERIATVAKTSSQVRLALQGRHLSKLKHVLVGSVETPFLEQTETVALVDLPSTSLAGMEHLLVRVKPDDRSAKGELLMVPFKPKVAIKKPVFAAAPIEVVQHFSGPVEVVGENLQSIDAISFEDLALKKTVAAKKLTLHLVSKVTEQAAPRSLTMKLVDGSEVPLPVIVKPRA